MPLFSICVLLSNQTNRKITTEKQSMWLSTRLIKVQRKSLCILRLMSKGSKERLKCIVCGKGFRDRTKLKVSTIVLQIYFTSSWYITKKSINHLLCAQEHSYIHSGINDATRKMSLFELNSLHSPLMMKYKPFLADEYWLISRIPIHIK